MSNPFANRLKLQQLGPKPVEEEEKKGIYSWSKDPYGECISLLHTKDPLEGHWRH